MNNITIYFLFINTNNIYNVIIEEYKFFLPIIIKDKKNDSCYYIVFSTFPSKIKLNLSFLWNYIVNALNHYGLLLIDLFNYFKVIIIGRRYDYAYELLSKMNIT